VVGPTVTELESVLSEIVPELVGDAVPFEIGYGGVDVDDELLPPPIPVPLGVVLVNPGEEELVAVALLGVEEEPLEYGDWGQ
jgi:hypothetical protein